MSQILFISRYYSPEKAAAAVCVSETARCLVKLGHQVTVLTTVPNYPTGIVPAEYRGHLVYQEVLEDVRVIRVWSYISPNEGFLRRILAQLSFGCMAALLAHKAIGHPDVIIVESPPLFNVIAARLLAWCKRCPLIFWVADLWPESAVQLGILRNRLLIRLSEWLEWSTYQRASIVWVVTEGIHETLFRRGIPLPKLLLITNGVDTSRFHPLPKAHARVELGWDDRFTLLYAGNHGLVYAMTTLLDAAELLQHYSEIHMILAGDGVRKAELMSEARKRGLKNVTFLEAAPHDRMPLLWAAADICLIPFRKLPLLEGSLPIKMFEMMACAKPFILGAGGIARNLAEQGANAGMVIEPENAEALVLAILYLRAHPEEAEALGSRGREYVKSHLDYERLTAALDARLTVLLDKKIPIPLQVTLSPFYLCWRKAIDVIFGLIGAVTLLLILPIVALLIYLDSPGPIFYPQERQGLQGKPFRMYKFRSMRTDAEYAGHAVWAVEQDPRVTRVGRHMRAIHLDELPQVFNILRGDMSLIGPRPEREEFAAQLEKTAPFYRSRLTIKPGLTGWAQVNFQYGNSEDDALIKLRYDPYYIKHQSFILDIFIILKTVGEVAFHRGT